MAVRNILFISLKKLTLATRLLQKQSTVIWKNYDGTVLETDTEVPYGEMPTYDRETPVKEETGYTNTFKTWSPEVVKVTGNAEYTARIIGTGNFFTDNTYTTSAGTTVTQTTGSLYLSSGTYKVGITLKYIVLTKFTHAFFAGIISLFLANVML